MIVLNIFSEVIHQQPHRMASGSSSASFQTFLETFNHFHSIFSNTVFPELLKEFDDYDTNIGFIIFETLVFLMETTNSFTEKDLKDWLIEKCPSSSMTIDNDMKVMYEVLNVTFNDYIYS